MLGVYYLHNIQLMLENLQLDLWTRCRLPMCYPFFICILAFPKRQWLTARITVAKMMMMMMATTNRCTRPHNANIHTTNQEN